MILHIYYFDIEIGIREVLKNEKSEEVCGLGYVMMIQIFVMSLSQC